jgi:hypothetical protein
MPPLVLLRAVRRLTDGAEEVLKRAPPSERPSLSANQAPEPQVTVARIKGSLDKPEFTSSRGGVPIRSGQVPPPLRQTDPLPANFNAHLPRVI